MIFHEKFFQCLAGAIPLFLTPQKIGLLKRHLNWFLIKSCRYVQYIHNPLLRSIIQALL